MSTLRDAILNDGSDDDNDPDFVPDEQPESDDDHKESHSVGQDQTHVDSGQTRLVEKEFRAKLWAEFQSSVTSSGPPPKASTPPKLVKVVKCYRFAGEDVVEIAEVPEDSEDAQKWPKYEPSSDHEGQNLADNTAVPSSSCSAAIQEPRKYNSTTSLNSKPVASSSITQILTDTPPKRPGPRKPKTLAAIPTLKPKKLTTLEKSAIDWKAHLASEAAAGSDVQDELTANRRGGGYLQKVDFLDRVGERREELFDQARSAKRRRGGT